MAQLWRVEVTEEGQPPLPAMHLEAPFVIGSSISARVRLPSSVAEPEHVRVDADGRWHAAVPFAGAEDGTIDERLTLAIGSYRVEIKPAVEGEKPTPAQRTESLARELMRNLLGTAGAPTLEIASGKLSGAKRPLAAPESKLVIGRGDEAGWIIADSDLSREHVEIRRTWDGVFIRDLDSKNGTLVDGEPLDNDEGLLHDGARIELGKLALVFRDPAEKHLGAAAARPRTSDSPSARVASPQSARPRSSASAPASTARASAAPFYIAVAVMLLALAGLVWILST
jgi:pSer/pThr/pTyr-binding forkhead associated (FHA) protein